MNCDKSVEKAKAKSWIFGVASYIANTRNCSPVGIRLLILISMILSAGFGVIIYTLFAIGLLMTGDYDRN
jgi:phage shock protein PspC (stress-responsive transcriptional regulator)